MTLATGWCLTGQHPTCPTTVHLSQQSTTITCECTCHGGAK